MTPLALRIALPTLAAALTLLPPAPLLAQAALGDVVFATVDAVETQTNSVFIVTGIVEGAAEPTRHTFSIIFSIEPQSGLNRCDRFALLAMSKPGRYQFSIVNASSSPSAVRCKLALRAP